MFPAMSFQLDDVERVAPDTFVAESLPATLPDEVFLWATAEQVDAVKDLRRYNFEMICTHCAKADNLVDAYLAGGDCFFDLTSEAHSIHMWVQLIAADLDALIAEERPALFSSYEELKALSIEDEGRVTAWFGSGQGGTLVARQTKRYAAALQAMLDRAGQIITESPDYGVDRPDQVAVL